jgi:hypothetical protein
MIGNFQQHPGNVSTNVKPVPVVGNDTKHRTNITSNGNFRSLVEKSECKTSQCVIGNFK